MNERIQPKQFVASVSKRVDKEPQIEGEARKCKKEERVKKQKQEPKFKIQEKDNEGGRRKEEDEQEQEQDSIQPRIREASAMK